MNARAIAVLCYGLIFVAWIVDLLTPQLFVAAILLNGPIALSGLALRPQLTVGLVVLAQIANIVAGYVNGLHDAAHWQPIAIGDRILSAASFLLVGYLTVRAQDFARRSGVAREREQRSAAEVRLRRALGAVHASLNVELVLRAVVREVVPLLRARSARLIVRSSSLQLPDSYLFERGGEDVTVVRRALDAHLGSLVQRVLDDSRAERFGLDDAVASTVVEGAAATTLLAAPIAEGGTHAVLFVFDDSPVFDVESEALLQGFANGAAVSLQQARLFMQLGAQNDEIARQRNALQERSRVIRDIVYALAHDLRTPLAAARVTMQQALDGAYGELPAAYREILQTSLTSNDDVQRLVETLLLVARYESGEDSTVRQPVDVRAQIERVTAELRSLAANKGVALQSKLGKDDAIVIGDAAELRRAIANLIANAITATPSGGTVWVGVNGDSERVSLNVEDTGYGVPLEQRSRLFERFGRSDEEMGSGTGLGLYIVRRIAEKHGGSASYAPRGEGGSRFTLTFPRASETHE
ncbi:MAG: sensor histidine kinase [Vulcanimicrobiaceae bacterium]